MAKKHFTGGSFISLQQLFGFWFVAGLFLPCLELIFNFQRHWSLQRWASLLACFLLLSWLLQSLGGKEKLN